MSSSEDGTGVTLLVSARVPKTLATPLPVNDGMCLTRKSTGALCKLIGRAGLSCWEN